MSERTVRPARPGTGFTEDGRRRREVLSYARRGGRLTPAQAGAWERRRDEWWIPDEEVEAADFRPADRFGRRAPLIVEVGSGVGEATAELAAARPSYDILAFEVWRPGVADTFRRLERAGVTNVRVASVDAVWGIEHLLAPGSVQELWTFFPDPWPKKRHRRRRLVNEAFAGLAASRLAPRGLWRLATDWPDYATQMRAVLDAQPLLTGGLTDRWADRPATRFERRGSCAGRSITDLTYRRG